MQNKWEFILLNYEGNFEWNLQFIIFKNWIKHSLPSDNRKKKICKSWTKKEMRWMENDIIIAFIIVTAHPELQLETSIEKLTIVFLLPSVPSSKHQWLNKIYILIEQMKLGQSTGYSINFNRKTIVHCAHFINYFNKIKGTAIQHLESFRMNVCWLIRFKWSLLFFCAQM